jgi:hypothetical protein
MNSVEFNKIVKRRCELIETVLSKKEEEYATDNNRLHNFYVAAELLDCTPPEALMGMMSKHVYSVIDMLVANGIDPSLFEMLIKDIFRDSKELSNKESSKKGKALTFEHLDEKIGDTINYLILLEGMLRKYIQYNTSSEG